MPSRGYKKPGARTGWVRFRVTQEEALALERAARRAHARSLSHWLRVLALDEAVRLGVLHGEGGPPPRTAGDGREP